MTLTFQVIKSGIKFKGTISANSLYIGEERYRIHFICAVTRTIEVESIGIIKQVK